MTMAMRWRRRKARFGKLAVEVSSLWGENRTYLESRCHDVGVLVGAGEGHGDGEVAAGGEVNVVVVVVGFADGLVDCARALGDAGSRFAAPTAEAVLLIPKQVLWTTVVFRVRAKGCCCCCCCGRKSSSVPRCSSSNGCKMTAKTARVRLGE